MKKILLIVLIALIILLGGAWIYLLLNGAPKSVTDITKNLFGTATNVANTPAVAPQAVAPINPDDIPTDRTVGIHAELVKLTERPVAGATMTSIGSGSTTLENTIRYMVKGTGYVYDISFATGVEKRVSNQVIPHVVQTIWSPKGTSAVLLTDADGLRGDTLLATFSTKESGDVVIDTEKLPSVDNVAFSATGDTLFYTEHDAQGGTTGFSRTVQTGAVQELFSLPFKENTMLWDIWENRVHYVYTKPALGFNGYLYQITSAGLKKIDSAKTLSATRIDAHTLSINKDSGKGPYSLLLDTEGGVGRFLSIETLPEKCAGEGVLLWCGTTESARNSSFPIAWYQGTITYADALWSTSVTTGDSKKVLDPETLSREQIDITDITATPDILLFKNKKDDSLWLYNLPQ